VAQFVASRICCKRTACGFRYFGSGQLGLGLEGFASGILVLTGLKKIEFRIPRRHSGILRINVLPNGPTQGEIAALLTRQGLSVTEPALSTEGSPHMD
jgi:hypothetical protein